MVNFGPLTAEIGWRVWGTPANFNGFSRLGFVIAPTSFNGGKPNFAQCLAVSWAGILPGAKFTLRPSLACSYIGSVTARHSCSERQPNFAEFSRGRHLYSAVRPSRWASAHILVTAYSFLVLPMYLTHCVLFKHDQHAIFCVPFAYKIASF